MKQCLLDRSSICGVREITNDSNEVTKKPVVNYIQRKQIPGATFSLEFIFNDLRSRLSDRIEARTHFARVQSRRILPRIYIAMDAAFRQGDINHVAGDIQFATAFLQRKKTVLTILDAGTFHRLSGVKKQLFRFFWFTPVLYKRNESIV